MSIRIIPQDQLEKSEKNTADTIPPLLFPRLKNLYSRRAARLRGPAGEKPPWRLSAFRRQDRAGAGDRAV